MPLGSGGFAQIYTVWDEKTQTEKVLKVLVEDSPKALELFTQEAAVLSSLHHSGTPRVDADGFFQINLVNPKPRQLACLVMEKINGKTLEEISKGYPHGCPEDLVLNWFAQAIKILQELHRRQIIHRDIKPSNLMLRIATSGSSQQIEQLVLIDFGGAKQFAGKLLYSHPTSTRLFSSGYSPPEQITGSNVGPAADFYALGRTIIELLTGKYPLDLEDPQTGELAWRNQCQVNPQLADLLDEMVQTNVELRPAHAANIHKRLARIIAGAKQQGYMSQLIADIVQIPAQLGQIILKIISFTFTTISQFFLACIATIWATCLSYICMTITTLVGFYIAYYTQTGKYIAELTSRELRQLIPLFSDNEGIEIIIFAFAGLGTAWGITLSGCFGQQRKFQMATLMGIISYSIGWIIWQFPRQNSSSLGGGLIIWIIVSASLLTLGLGVRSHNLVYAFIAASGSATLLVNLITSNWLQPVPSFSSILSSIGFFGLVSLLINFSLSITYYLIVPCLRRLGWY